MIYPKYDDEGMEIVASLEERIFSEAETCYGARCASQKAVEQGQLESVIRVLRGILRAMPLEQRQAVLHDLETNDL